MKPPTREERELTLEECIDDLCTIDPKFVRQIVERIITHLRDHPKCSKIAAYRIEKALREIVK